MSLKSDRSHTDGLSDLPAWGLEIMMGLYGPRTIENALNAPTPAYHLPQPPITAPRAMPVSEFGDPTVSPALAEFAAIDALGKRVARMFRRH